MDLGTGEVVVLLHGLGSKKESWKNQYELSNHFRLIMPDIRGHGESNETEDITIKRFAKDVLNLLDQLKITKSHFCGISMGGIIAQEIYRLQPERVISLILSNTMSYAPRILGNFLLRPSINNFKNRIGKDITYEGAKKCLYRKTPNLIKEVEETLLIKPESYVPASLSALETNYLWMLPFVKVPTLIIGSMYDEIVTIWASLQTKMVMPQADIFIFQECGHTPNIEQKETFNSTIFNFLDKHKEIQNVGGFI